jgi:hypothetical protein
MSKKLSVRFLVVCLLTLLTISVYSQSAVAQDDASLTKASCGKPVRDYTFPEPSSDGKTRFLTYHRATVWFIDRGKGWNFEGWGRTADETPVLTSDGLAKVLPCFAKVLKPVVATPTAPDPAVSQSTEKSPADISDGVEIALWIIGGILYFVPIFIASHRNVNNQGGIVALDLLLGWTLLGWVGALIWALSAETTDQAKLREAALAQMAQGIPQEAKKEM